MSEKKISPNLLASYLTFIFLGLYSYYNVNGIAGDNQFIKISMSLVLVANATWYFWYELFLERNLEIVKKLKNASKFEWYLRVIAQLILFSLWMLMEYNWFAFFGGLIALYATYIIWSILVWNVIDKKALVYLDIFGLVLSVIFYKISSTFDADTVNYIYGLITTLYILIPLIGTFVITFDIRKKDDHYE